MTKWGGGEVIFRILGRGYHIHLAVGPEKLDLTIRLADTPCDDEDCEKRMAMTDMERADGRIRFEIIEGELFEGDPVAITMCSPTFTKALPQPLSCRETKE